MDEWKQIFLMSLAEEMNVSLAAQVAGRARPYCYEARDNDPEFAEQWAAIEQAWVDKAERELYRRAVEGTNKPVFYKGEEVGSIREYSDQLLTTFLKAKRPNEYRPDGQTVNLNATANKLYLDLGGDDL